MGATLNKPWTLSDCYWPPYSQKRSAEFSDRIIRLEVLDGGENDPKESRSAKNAPASTLSDDSSQPAPPDVDDIPVNSILLAAKSSVLRTMLSNGMRESEKSAPVIFRVTLEEKAAFEEMLRFFYSGTLSQRLHVPTIDVQELVSLLLLADKYDVPSLMSAVCEHLRKADGVELVNRVPPAIRLLSPMEGIMDDAIARVVEAFKDVSGKWGLESFLSLILEVVEVLLGSEELEADSEEEIFDKVLAWVQVNFPSLSLRSSAISRLSPLIRFSCMSGEYLETLLPREELQNKETQALITAALRFQAYSDVKKQEMRPEGVLQRTGVRNVHLEILDHFVLNEGGTKQESRSAVWFGKQWFIQVQKDSRNNPPTVGVFLCCGESPCKASPSTATDTLAFKIYVRTCPSGMWKEVFNEESQIFSLDEKQGNSGWGLTDALQMPWDQARESERFVGSIGTVSFKIVLRRFRS